MSFTPVRKFIDDVSINTRAVVTTSGDHGYLDGYVVRVIVPEAYGMDLYEQTKIIVTGSDSFITDINTTAQLPFTAPSFSANGQAFTEAQVIPMTGTEVNIL